jgi:hypothetical protein
MVASPPAPRAVADLARFGVNAAPTREPLMSDVVKGPASYFPSIEKKYGRPISDWQKRVRDAYPAKHMELVAVLKGHGLGHGHANAVVAYTLAEDGLK